MTDHTPDCLTQLKVFDPSGQEHCRHQFICTCAAKERARIAELEQALALAEQRDSERPQDMAEIILALTAKVKDLEQALDRAEARRDDYEKALQAEKERVSYLESENAEAVASAKLSGRIAALGSLHNALYPRISQPDTERIHYDVVALVEKLESENAELRDELERHDGRRREGRQLLRRIVKYIREDRAETKGSTRLFRLTDQVADYLERTNDPNDILRGPAAIDLAAADETEKTEKPEPR